MIRQAEPNDLEDLVQISAETFRSAFQADNEPSNIESYLQKAFSREQVSSELGESNSRFLLALTTGQTAPVGYAKLRSAEVNSKVRGTRPVELQRLYVDHEYHGGGVGPALLKRCLNEAYVMGFRTVWLGVWEKNPRAIRFYEKWGFETVGSHIFDLGDDRQVDLILERPLTPEDGAPVA